MALTPEPHAMSTDTERTERLIVDVDEEAEEQEQLAPSDGGYTADLLRRVATELRRLMEIERIAAAVERISIAQYHCILCGADWWNGKSITSVVGHRRTGTFASRGLDAALRGQKGDAQCLSPRPTNELRERSDKWVAEHLREQRGLTGVLYSWCV
jgi:hypothetical protein